MSDAIPFISFLTDYGTDDEFVGVCHGVIATICPRARVIDVTHGIARHDVRAGAIALAEALPYLPAGVHLAVVDPGVGARRRAVALGLADGRRLVGPDNGLLWPAALAGGGVVEVAEITRSPFRLEPVSATFHGRDIFAPVAARLAAGVALAQTGDALEPAELVTLQLSGGRARIQDGALIAQVRGVDHFGNLQLDAGADDLAGIGLEVGRTATLQPAGGATYPLPYVRTFTDVGPGELLLYEDAQRRLAVAVSHGDAGLRLGSSRGDEIRIRRA
jgi:S-adenosylmethionine hydrolase